MIADDLRANSGLDSNEYFIPIIGILFLRHTTNCYCIAKTAGQGRLRSNAGSTARRLTRT